MSWLAKQDQQRYNSSNQTIVEQDYAQGGADSQYGSYVELPHFSRMAGVKRMIL